jgi:serine/threonine-protein kinase RsbW
LDLSDVDYADSSALGLIVSLDRAVSLLDGRVVLAGASGHVSRILELSGLLRAAPTVSAAQDCDDALSALTLPDLSAEPLWHQRIELVADPSTLAEMRAQVCDMLMPLRIPEPIMYDIRVAVGEALANAIRHGSSPGADDRVAVEVETFEDRVVLTVIDSGCGFDGVHGVGGDLYAASGRGVMFMRALMDRVEFGPALGGGTVVTLTKHTGVAPSV